MTKMVNIKNNSMKNLKSKKTLILIVLSIFFLWVLITELKIFTSYRLPSPFAVAVQFSGFAFLSQVKVTVIEVLIGYTLGAALGISIAILACYNEMANHVLSFASLFFASISKGTLAPIFVLFLGYELAPLVAVTALICFFPVLTNTLDGLRNVDPTYIEMMRSMQASKWNIFKKLRLHNALPQMFSGLKIAAPLAMVGAILGEFLIGMEGVGTLLQLGVSLLDSSIVFAAIIWMAILGTFTYCLILIAERLILPPAFKRRWQG